MIRPPRKKMPALMATQQTAATMTVLHWSAKSRSFIVVPMWTSSMQTSTPETASSVESSNMVVGSRPDQNPP